MKVKAKIETNGHIPYTFTWINDTVAKDAGPKKYYGTFHPRITEINFYNPATDDDIYLEVEEEKVNFSSRYKDRTPILLSETKDPCTIELHFHGEITFEIDTEQSDILEEQDFSVDYEIEWYNDHGVAESDEDYEFVENQNLTLEIMEVME